MTGRGEGVATLGDQWVAWCWRIYAGDAAQLFSVKSFRGAFFDQPEAFFSLICKMHAVPQCDPENKGVENIPGMTMACAV